MGSGRPIIGATVLDLQDDGTMRTVGKFRATSLTSKDPGWTPCDNSCVDPVVSAPDSSSLVCLLGDHWSSGDDQVLLLEGDCSDGTTREIRLRFPEDSSSNSQMGGVQVEVASVEGQSGWRAAFAGWSWSHCTEASCPR